jgi:hypothetical protein
VEWFLAALSDYECILEWLRSNATKQQFTEQQNTYKQMAQYIFSLDAGRVNVVCVQLYFIVFESIL